MGEFTNPFINPKFCGSSVSPQAQLPMLMLGDRLCVRLQDINIHHRIKISYLSASTPAALTPEELPDLVCADVFDCVCAHC